MAKKKNQHRQPSPSYLPTYLVVGAGISGAVIARRLAEKYQQPIWIIDRRNHLGGNCYDQKITNIQVHRYGAHIFHTQKQKVWQFLSRFCQWYPYEHQVKAQVAGHLVTLPFNLDTLATLFPTELASQLEKQLIAEFGFAQKITLAKLQNSLTPSLQELSTYIKKHFFAYYSRKQWGVTTLDQIDPQTLARVPISIDRDQRYFADIYQGIPAQGYTHLIACLLDHPCITIKLQTSYTQVRHHLNPQKTFYTGSIDEFFDYQLGTLPYRSCRFVDEVINRKYFQPVAVVNYPETQAFTRIIEHKHFLPTTTAHTLISYEYPEAFRPDCNERFYPINNDTNQKLLTQYQKLAHQQADVVFFGRLGDYHYYNMDQAIARALEIKI